jgi:ADP-heptose:LPS heptosyltransferase
MSILIIKDDGLGDLILTSGFISALSQFFQTPITLATSQHHRDWASQISGVTDIVSLERDAFWGTPETMKGTPEGEQALQSLQQQAFEYIVVPRRFIRKSTLLLMSALKGRHQFACYLYPSNATMAFARQCTSHYRLFPEGLSTLPLHETDYYRSFFHWITGSTQACLPVLMDRPTTKGAIDKIVLICTGASSRWSAYAWKQLFQTLKALSLSLTLIDDHRHQDTLAFIDPQGEALHLIEPERSTFLHALSGALVIGNDTGLTHAATLYASHTLVLSGGMVLGHFFPWPGPYPQTTLFSFLPCFGCNHQCLTQDQKCLETLTPERVFASVCKILESVPVQDNHSLDPYTPSWRLGRGLLEPIRVGDRHYHIAPLPQGSRVVLFGAGESGRLALRMLSKQIQCLGFVDNQPLLQGATIEGLRVYSLQQAFDLHPQWFLICSQQVQDILRQLDEHHWPRGIIAFFRP